MTSLAQAWRRPAVRGYAYQAALVAGLVILLWATVHTVAGNLARLDIKTGFGFLGEEAGFGISQTLIPYSHQSTYARAILVAFLNTVVLSLLAIVACTVLGLVIALARMSPNWLLEKIGAAYVETFRNVPLLLQLFFWYNAALRLLPAKRQSISLFDSVFLNIEGLFVPFPIFQAGSGRLGVALLAVIAAAVVLDVWARRRQRRTGRPFPRLGAAVAVVVVGAALAIAAFGFPIAWDIPHFQRFNFQGGAAVQPEFVAMLLGLTLYNGAFVGEIIRAGILSVPKGQREAARSIGLDEVQIYARVILPQARRLIIPPLTNQYLNLTKSTALAAAIGYPELFWALGGAIQAQTGQILELQAITLLTYLAISLVIAAVMNGYNRRLRRIAV